MKRRIYGLTLAAIALAAVGAMGVLNAGQPAAQDAKPAMSSAAAAAEQHERPLAISQADAKLAWGDCPALFPPGCKISVLHGDPNEPGADVFLRVPAGYTIPAHSHTSAERMVLVSGQLDVTYAGHAKVALQRGDYAYGPAKLPHTARCNGAEACTLFIAFDKAIDALPFEGELKHAAR
jgi:quercetin dioxygenase-like cupin family protein